MDIEVLQTFLHGPERFTAGDVRNNVEDELGAYFCRAGWARDLSGKVLTGEHKQGEVILAPDSVQHAVTTN